MRKVQLVLLELMHSICKLPPTFNQLSRPDLLIFRKGLEGPRRHFLELSSIPMINGPGLISAAMGRHIFLCLKVQRYSYFSCFSQGINEILIISIKRVGTKNFQILQIHFSASSEMFHLVTCVKTRVQVDSLYISRAVRY